MVTTSVPRCSSDYPGATKRRLSESSPSGARSVVDSDEGGGAAGGECGHVGDGGLFFWPAHAPLQIGEGLEGEFGPQVVRRRPVADRPDMPGGQVPVVR